MERDVKGIEAEQRDIQDDLDTLKEGIANIPTGTTI